MEDDPYPPPTPVTELVNTIPPRVDHSVLPARMLEALVMKNQLLKHLQVTRVGPASDVRDPGFNAMKDPALILWAIVGVFNTAGYSVTIRDREAILKYGKEALASAGQAVYDLFLRHQMQRKIEQAMTKAAGGLADEDEVRQVAEQYIGKSKAQVTRMQEDIYLKDSIISGLERYVQELADERDAAIKQKTLLAAPNGVRHLKATADMPNEYASEARPTQPGLDPASTGSRPTRSRRPDVKMEGGGTKMQQEAPPTPFSSGDYLADIYDACISQDRLVNSAARLRASAVSDLKAFDGRHRDEFKGKGWLSSVRAAFRRDQFTDGECCLHFPDLLSDRSKTWYRQLPPTVRADWGRLQAEFEQEYCGATVTPQQRYFEMRRRANEESIDYLYRLNVQAREAGLAYDRPENARPHVRQFISSCEDPELARQLAGLRLSNEEELRDVLKQLLYQSMRAKRDDIVKGRTSKRDQDQARELREGRPKERNAKPAQLGSKGRPIQVYALNGTSSDDPEYSDSDVSDEEGGFDPHDVGDDDQEADSITRDDDRG
ncbi:hypothetical protein ATCC90586_012104 [Pythium insidiosum]|nr:hypothetical protein ATCC90586_012104 [Pythium insidiosum]